MATNCENLSAIIGVGGTILGFILNQAIRIGKIKVFVNNIHEKIYTLDENGNPSETNTIDRNTESVTINLDVYFFNTSSFKQKIGRDFHIMFRTPKGNVNKEIIDNDGNEFTHINLKPNEVIKYDLQVHLKEDLEVYKELDFYLIYKDNRDCTKKIKIKKAF